VPVVLNDDRQHDIGVALELPETVRAGERDRAKSVELAIYIPFHGRVGVPHPLMVWNVWTARSDQIAFLPGC